MHTEIIDPVVNLVSVLLEVPEDIYQQEKMKVFSLDEYKPVARYWKQIFAVADQCRPLLPKEVRK